MNSHKAAIAHIRQKIKDLSAEKPVLRTKLHELKNCVTSSADTGPERYQLRLDYVNGTQDSLRHLYIAYAILRGRPYQDLEAKCSEPPYPKTVSWHIYRAFGINEDAKTWTEEERQVINTWDPLQIYELMYGKGTSQPPDAPMVVVPVKPKNWFSSLLSRVLA